MESEKATSRETKRLYLRYTLAPFLSLLTLLFMLTVPSVTSAADVSVTFDVTGTFVPRPRVLALTQRTVRSLSTLQSAPLRTLS